MSTFGKKLLGATAVAFMALGAVTASHAATILSDEFIVYNGKGKVRVDIQVPENGDSAEGVIQLVKTSINKTAYDRPIVLMDAGGQISDVFGICKCGGKSGKALALAFISDAQGPIDPALLAKFNIDNAQVLAETKAGPWNATRFLSRNAIEKGFTARFWSDVEANPPIPEPATWALMLTGFGLGGAALRRRRAVAAA